MTGLREPGDPRETLRTRRMSAAQWAGIVCCCGMMIVDGYDTLAISLALPGIAAEWATAKVALGGVVSIGLIGMALGALLLGPLGDMIGRRAVVFWGLGLTFAGMGLSAAASGIGHLMLWRLLTGIGMGGLVAVAYPLAAEYSNLRNRPTTLSMLVICFPLGGVFGGTVASWLMPEFGWRSAFLPGLVFPFVVACLCIRWLPEPLGLLIERPKPSSLAKANLYLRRVGLPVLDRLPPPAQVDQVPVRRVLGREFLAPSIYLTLIYSLSSCVAYFLVAWLPQIVAGLGFTPAAAATVSVAVNVGGLAGAALTGIAIRRLGAFPAFLAVLLGLAAIVAVIGVAPANMLLLRVLGFLAGIGIWGAIVGMNVLIAEAYPVEVRATGNGFVVGSSRWAAAAGPVLGGLLFSQGLSAAASCAAAALPCLAAAGLLAQFDLRRRRLGRNGGALAPAE